MLSECVRVSECVCVLPAKLISVLSRFRPIHSSQFLLTQSQFGAILDGPEHGSEPINVGWEMRRPELLEAKGGSDAGKLRRLLTWLHCGTPPEYHELDLFIKNSLYL